MDSNGTSLEYSEHSTSGDHAVLTATLQPRLRHISAIHVRNLTPFPARDALASALAQPSEQPQFTEHGQLSDDWDVTVSRRRSRKVSVTSNRSLHGLWSEPAPSAVESSHGNALSRIADQRGRQRKVSQGKSMNADMSGPSSSAASTPVRPSSTGASGPTPTIRPRRQRNLSIRSGSSGLGDTSMTATTQASLLVAPSSSLSSMLPDNTQKGLEKVITSRLVETFLSITILSPEGQHAEAPTPSTPKPVSHTPSHAKDKASSLAAKVKQINGTSASPRETSRARFNTPSKEPREPVSARPSPVRGAFNHARSSSTASQSNGRVTSPTATTFPSTSRAPPPISTPQSSTASTSSSSVPDYLTPIHRPSTNPSFLVDAGPAADFPNWIDSSADRLRVELWGRVGDDWAGNISAKGKEKERYPEMKALSDAKWKVLQTWDVHLEDLVPLPTDKISQLPSNTLLVTLTPPGQVFYLPPSQYPPSPPTPSAGYNSDPELEVRVAKQSSGQPPSSTQDVILSPAQLVSRSRRRHRKALESTPNTIEDSVKTAGWQDIFKLVTLQSCIVDTRSSLTEVVHKIDKTLESDLIPILKREAAERRSYVEGLKADYDAVNATSEELRRGIDARRRELQERRELLALARDQLVEDQRTNSEVELQVREEELRLQALRARLPMKRTALLSTLASIFPIELLSPPDLLYTIVDVPLPIPIAHGDPAPPLTLAQQPEVTEDGVATALGYVAQVVQLLAAYLGKGLVYPVTCIGSRSLVRDGISAMVGPRMFPLFSRGVDTYRFEYGVFLLNKDIEMLMTDRDLRALDMRHTLPNLKNLLLTLTDGEEPIHPRSAQQPFGPYSSAYAASCLVNVYRLWIFFSLAVGNLITADSRLQKQPILRSLAYVNGGRLLIAPRRPSRIPSRIPESGRLRSRRRRRLGTQGRRRTVKPPKRTRPLRSHLKRVAHGSPWTTTRTPNLTMPPHQSPSVRPPPRRRPT
ncbi:hypothetical protein HGRIS_007390 [Hohenbuehelia grisea]|uniref:Autophagy-related protein 14 n=1 Tax=Hohenbuehelia grisea TaxID=104357 RepID=A0ABR3J4N4_9AGAR